MILVCYDGSPEAQAAIEHAGELLNGRQATVLTVWEPFVDVMARSGTAMGLGARSLNYEEIDAANERARSSRGAYVPPGAARSQRVVKPAGAPHVISISTLCLRLADRGSAPRVGHALWASAILRRAATASTDEVVVGEMAARMDCHGAVADDLVRS